MFLKIIPSRMLCLYLSYSSNYYFVEIIIRMRLFPKIPKIKKLGNFKMISFLFEFNNY
jgi:hypothetical protein